VKHNGPIDTSQFEVNLNVDEVSQKFETINFDKENVQDNAQFSETPAFMVRQTSDVGKPKYKPIKKQKK
jgi:hypothetical protein